MNHTPERPWLLFLNTVRPHIPHSALLDPDLDNPLGPRNTLALASSVSMPLDVHLLLSSSSDRAPARSFGEACDHIHRWRTANLGIPLGQTLLNRLATPAPLLEEAYIHVLATLRIDRRISNAFVDLFLGQALQLPSLHLWGVAIPWSTGMLSRLHTLKLEYIESRCPTASELFAVLAASPQLSTPKLKRAAVDYTTEPASIPVTCLPFPAYLEIAAIDPAIVGLLLRHIECPSCQELRIRCQLDDDNELAHFRFLTPLIPRPLSSETYYAQLSVSFFSITFTLPHFHISLSRIDGEIVLPYLLRTILTAELLRTDTELIIGKNHFFENESQSLLEVAKCHACHNPARDLARFRSRSPTPSLMPGILPGLREVSINIDGATPGLLTEMVQARHDPKTVNLLAPFDLLTRSRKQGKRTKSTSLRRRQSLVMKGVVWKDST